MGIRDTLHRLRDFWNNGFDYSNTNETEIFDEIKNVMTFGLLPSLKIPRKGFRESYKEYAQRIVDESKRTANQINTCSDVDEFICFWEYLNALFEKLIDLNENKNIFMYPTPRTNWEDIQSNFHNTLNNAIDRFFSNCESQNDRERITQAIYDNNRFVQLLCPENIQKIKEYSELREMSGDEETTFSSQKDEPHSPENINEANVDTGERPSEHCYTDEKIPSRDNKAHTNEPPKTDNRRTTKDDTTNADNIPNPDASWHIRTQDMLQFVSIPYDMSDPLYDSVDASGNPFAYMPLYDNPYNLGIAWRHIDRLNRIVSDNRHKLQKFAGDLRIDRDEAENFILICTPYTSKGRIARIPISLKFVSSSIAKHHKIEGFIHYKANGKIQDANVIVHREISEWSQYDPFDPFHSEYEFSTRLLDQKFTFICINNELTLYKAFQCTRLGNESITDEYKHELLIERELEKERDLRYYKHLKTLLPEQCPKSFAAYRRKRALKTEKYFKICAALEEKFLHNNDSQK